MQKARQVHLLTVAIFKLSLTCILSASFSGTGSVLSRYASKPGGLKTFKTRVNTPAAEGTEKHYSRQQNAFFKIENFKTG